MAFNNRIQLLQVTVRFLQFAVVDRSMREIFQRIDDIFFAIDLLSESKGPHCKHSLA